MRFVIMPAIAALVGMAFRGPIVGLLFGLFVYFLYPLWYILRQERKAEKISRKTEKQRIKLVEQERERQKSGSQILFFFPL